ncbi:MAG: recombination protein RmuC [Pseudomonadota bacterium]|jgi:DNA recombination protein RmuC
MSISPEHLIWLASSAIAIAVLLILIWLVARLGSRLGDLQNRFQSLQINDERLERGMREEMADNRREASAATAQNRDELNRAIERLSQTLSGQNDHLRKLLDDKLTQAQQDARSGRTEQAESLKGFGELLTGQLHQLMQRNTEGMDTLRQAIETRLAAIQTDNSQKLEQMRQTVDEKLHNTLEQRLGESFKRVSEQLERVHAGLGEMQTLASGVGDLKKVLSNVKVRGTWGEVQLDNLLEQILSAGQYEKNVATRPNSAERVEFAIKLPGRDEAGSIVWLPIDAKFPLEDYQKLLEAQELGDLPAMEDAGRAMENRVRAEAKTIRDKYIEVPHTTDFALLFLPIEGLYAEVIRRPGLFDTLQRDYRVTLTGPTTLTAILNSLQMGFRTLAIEQRSSEVWQVLGAVKTEFGKFGDVLAKTKKKLDEASRTIEQAEVRTRAIDRSLRKVESLPIVQSRGLLEDLTEDATLLVDPTDLAP